ncbi:PAS domain S-box protein [Xylophilus sp. GOD-11R]|uniref:PAS domain-containing hybrid sensor histidine kinase/response regulator n=1 Tax=Xylophilus sp. GOD-11R TaxID=3089814 RepID=UPI00298C8A7B|nr:PAS domain S-box protein [Xylophilus sp. GOD-11R]WPB59010.1 PAS domain S-box protein [Xylophilus sp. GOD-11R]
MVSIIPKLDLGKLFVEMSSLLVCVTATPEFRVLAASDAFLDATSIERGRLLGHPLLEYLHCSTDAPDNGVHCLRHGLEEVLSTGSAHHAEPAKLLLPRPDGGTSTLHLEMTHTPVHREGGELACILIVARDVTLAVEAREHLQAQEARTRQILDSAIDYAIIATDLDGRITGWNQGAANVFGWTEADALGMPLDRIYLPEDCMAEVPAKERDEARQTGKAPDDGWHVRKGGERFWASGRMTPLRNADGSITGFLKILRDQTEREHMARELELKLEALANFNTTLEQRVAQKAAERDRIWQLSNDLMDVCDRQRRLVSVNAAWTAVLGWPEEEVVGRYFIQLVHQDDRGAADAVLTSAQSAHRAMWFEARVRHRDGRYCTMSWMVSPDRGRFYMVGRDVTHQRETEAKLRQSQKMEALGQLTGGIAHDFNNLLATITGSLELLKRKTEAGETSGLERWTAMASGAAQRASALVQRLLAFSRNQSLDLKPVDVVELTAGMEDLMHRTLGENVEIELVLPSAPCHANTDANQLENALLNLAINARDAMAGDGHLRIGVQRVEWNARVPGVDLPPGDYVRMSVTDNGMGMPPDVLARAFDPFFTTKPVGQGTGLGLSMIYGFARQSGGGATIESTPGEGTTVSIYLPHFVDTPVQADTDDPTHPPQKGQECVLLVEDDASLRSVVRESLDGLGYAVHEASSAQAAMMLLDSGVNCELLVTDVGLPGMDGRQLAAMVRRRLPMVRVLFMTGYASQMAAGSDFLAEGMAMLAKPFSLQKLATQVRAMLDFKSDPMV